MVGVLEYFNENWGNITDQWVRFKLTKHHMYGNDTNNRTESINQKIKAIIVKYSSLPIFFDELMACIASCRIEKDIAAGEVLMRQRVNTNYAYYDMQYYNLLTEYAFDLYHEEAEKHQRVQFTDIDERIAVFRYGREQLMATANTCDCIFFTSMHLPCKHILAFRSQKEQCLYDPDICSQRWLKSNISFVTQSDYVFDETPNLEIFQTQNEGGRFQENRTCNQKYRAAKKKCDEICYLMSELPEEEFKQNMNLLNNVLKNLRETANVNEGSLFYSFYFIQLY